MFRRVAVALAAVSIVACMPGSATPSESATETSSAAASPSEAATATPEPDSSDLLVARYAGETNAPLGYFEYLPPDYEGDGPSPLLVFLHGFGENGDGTERDLSLILETGIPDLLRDGQWPLDRPFVVLSPQHDTPVDPETVPDDEFFQTECDWEPEVAAFIDFALAEYDVDPDRVYLTGLSCGAYGAWMYLAEHGASQIAAMVPIAGPADEAWAQSGCNLGAVPIWAFHGDADEIVSVTFSTVPMATLSQCPAPPLREATMTVYPGVDHDSWTQTYDLSAGHDIYSWLLQWTKPD
jgi:predicted peptidase